MTNDVDDLLKRASELRGEGITWDAKDCPIREADARDVVLLADEIERLQKALNVDHEFHNIDDVVEIRKLRAELEQYKTWHAGGRANIERQGDVLRICDGEHEKFAPCQFVEYRRVSGDSRLAPEPEAQCICPSGGYDSYCKVHGVLNQQSPEKSETDSEGHMFAGDGLTDECRFCGRPRAVHP